MIDAPVYWTVVTELSPNSTLTSGSGSFASSENSGALLSAVPQTMLSSPSEVPQTMLSPPSVPHTMLSPGSAVPQTMLSSSAVPHTMLSQSSVPHTMLSTRLIALANADTLVPQTMLSSSDVPQTMLSQLPSQSVPHTMLSPESPSVFTVPQTMLFAQAFASGFR